MNLVIYGIVFILFGSIYLWKPTLFRRGIWMKTSIAIRVLSETNYTRYMRGLGFILVITGIALIVFETVWRAQP
jgi:uncharacterized protein YjeT (DUF2065 family)